MKHRFLYVYKTKNNLFYYCTTFSNKKTTTPFNDRSKKKESKSASLINASKAANDDEDCRFWQKQCKAALHAKFLPENGLRSEWEREGERKARKSICIRGWKWVITHTHTQHSICKANSDFVGIDLKCVSLLSVH